MLSALLAVIAAAQPVPTSGPPAAWLVATVDQSEWCPAGNVRLDLTSGRYAYTPGAPRQQCNRRDLQRPERLGTLNRSRLTELRAAFRRALEDTVAEPTCRAGRGEVVIDNGGPRVLVMSDGARTVGAPSETRCWTDSARALHRWLSEEFQARNGRRR